MDSGLALKVDDLVSRLVSELESEADVETQVKNINISVGRDKAVNIRATIEKKLFIPSPYRPRE